MESHSKMHEGSPKPEEERIITSKPSILVDDEHAPSNKESLTLGTQQQQQEEGEEADDQQSSTESASASNYEQQITSNSTEAERGRAEDDASSATGSREIKKMQKDEPTCKHCARSFKSLKALFGHMRTHPREDEACTSCSHQTSAAAPVTYDADQPEAKRVKLECAAADGRYACHICSKTFPTHQALGGHVAFHNKLCRQGEDGGQAPRASRRMASEDGELHRCKVCSAAFETGQSLGGHMRKHFDLQKLKTNMIKAASLSKETKQLPPIEEDAATRKDRRYEEIALLENVRGERGDGAGSDFIEMAEAEAEEMCRLKL